MPGTMPYFSCAAFRWSYGKSGFQVALFFSSNHTMQYIHPQENASTESMYTGCSLISL